MTIRPFKFRLKKVSEEDSRLIDGLMRFLPASGLQGNVKRAVDSSLRSNLGSDATLKLESVFQEPFSQALGKMSESAVHAVFGVDPINRKAICEIDPVLSLIIIDRVLGGSTNSLPDSRPVTDTELGVLQYVIVQVMAGIYRNANGFEPVHFRFDRFSEATHKLSNVAGPHDGVVTLIFRLSIGKHSGFVKIVLPNPFIEEAFLNNMQASEQMSDDELSASVDRMSDFGYVDSVLWGEAGRTSLSPSDLAGIEEGDIVLFDSSEVVMNGNVPSGKALLRLGNGLSGAFESEISVEGDIIKCEVLRFVEGE